MTFSSTLSSIIETIKQFIEWVSFIGNREQYHLSQLQRTLEKIKFEFKQLALDNKLAFFEVLVNSRSSVLYSESSVFDQLHRRWLQVLQNPVLKQNTRELDMFRHSLERNIFESKITDEKKIRQFNVLLNAGTHILPSSASAIKRGHVLLSNVKHQTLITFVKQFALLSLAQKRLILRYLGGNKKLKVEGFSKETLENITENLTEKSKDMIRPFVDCLFQSLGEPSRYHTQLRNKIFKHLGLDCPRVLTFKFGHNLSPSLLVPPEPVPLPFSPSMKR